MHPGWRRGDPVIYIAQDFRRCATDGQLVGSSWMVVISPTLLWNHGSSALWQLGQRVKMGYHCHKIKRGMLLLAVLVCPPRLGRRMGVGTTLPSARRSRTSPGRCPGWWLEMFWPPGHPLIRLPPRKSHTRCPHTPGAGPRAGWTAPIDWRMGTTMRGNQMGNEPEYWSGNCWVTGPGNWHGLQKGYGSGNCNRWLKDPEWSEQKTGPGAWLGMSSWWPPDRWRVRERDQEWLADGSRSLWRPLHRWQVREWPADGFRKVWQPPDQWQERDWKQPAGRSRTLWRPPGRWQVRERLGDRSQVSGQPADGWQVREWVLKPPSGESRRADGAGIGRGPGDCREWCHSNQQNEDDATDDEDSAASAVRANTDEGTGTGSIGGVTSGGCGAEDILIDA